MTSVGVLVSGAGTNLLAMLEACKRPESRARIALVISNRSTAGALEICKYWHVPHRVMPLAEFDGDSKAHDAAILAAFLNAGVDLVVCAGYDRELSRDFLDAFPDAVINVHHSLLPAFAGTADPITQALQSGVKITGCTVQFLTPGGADGGPIILQAAVAINDDDDAETLGHRIHEQEGRLLPSAVDLWAAGRLRREGQKVEILSHAPALREA